MKHYKIINTESYESIKLGIDAHAKWYYVARQLDGATPQPVQKMDFEDRVSEAHLTDRGDGGELADNVGADETGRSGDEGAKRFEIHDQLPELFAHLFLGQQGRGLFGAQRMSWRMHPPPSAHPPAAL